MEKFIIDSDWGCDVLQLCSVLIANPAKYEVLGATITFGNAPHDQNLENAGAMLRLLGQDTKIPRYPGAKAPRGVDAPPEGDGAHGATGLGELQIKASEVPAKKLNAVDFILQTLRDAAPDTITLIATGPQSNIAEAIIHEPETMRRLKEIRIMGGCIEPMPGYHIAGDTRISEDPIPRLGNITVWGEFNFQQAPADAQVVLESGIPIRLFPMNCTHQMTFTAEREAKVKQAFDQTPELCKIACQLLSAPRAIDALKFGIDPTLHDVHTTIELLEPKLYLGRQGYIEIDTSIERAGYTHFNKEPSGPHWVADRVLNPDLAFDVLLNSFLQTLTLD